MQPWVIFIMYTHKNAMHSKTKRGRGDCDTYLAYSWGYGEEYQVVISYLPNSMHGGFLPWDSAEGRSLLPVPCTYHNLQIKFTAQDNQHFTVNIKFTQHNILIPQRWCKSSNLTPMTKIIAPYIYKLRQCNSMTNSEKHVSQMHCA